MNPLLSQTSRLTVGRHSNLMQCVHKLSKRNYLMPRMAVRSGNPQPLHITKNTFNCKQYQISTRGLATIHSNLGSTPTDIGSRPRATQKFLDKASAEIQSTMGFDTSSDSNEFQNTPTMSTQSTLSDSQTRKHAHMGPPGSVNDDAIDWGARTSPLNSGSGFGPNAKHIDTLTLSQKLNTSGFKPEQSEQIVRILMDVIRER
ncbi:hypothetical protein SARC_10506 [Sphaeroforma arctica JP610]|uniref:Uncharacterized protein n=1 Tax=Sphaeroforma arctica JP610 TaxID=667725 RepID=A0A0L0FJR7_9EUKA|nr:hypothetical protein SARC_10506 [Sphaeroforma arctica JP610]KNC77022.1 hypothetical protein SARC_10506 [Sphaeroforma arctica JP610]|eukprot:XP_014150924.1 hypothetical protein SARC_10506 [Sphaeroforma arctica JP610]